MAISYTKKTWLDSPNTTTPLSAANLQIMDDGIQAACDAVDAMPSVRAAALTSDFTLTQSNTTLENVTGLALSIAANEVLTFEAFVFTSATADDFKLSFDLPSGASCLYQPNYKSVTIADTLACITWTSASADSLLVAGNQPLLSIYRGTVINSSTAGSIQIQVAQNAGTAADMYIKAGSVIRGEVW